MFCKNCGNELPDDAIFCPECGTKIIEEPQEPQYEEPRYQEPQYEEPRYQEQRYEEPRYQEPRYDATGGEPPQKESLKKWYVLLGVMFAVIVALAIVMVVLIANKKSSHDDTKQATKVSAETKDKAKVEKTDDTDADAVGSAPAEEAASAVAEDAKSDDATESAAQKNDESKSQNSGGYVEKSQSEIETAMNAYNFYVNNSFEGRIDAEAYDVLYLDNDNIPEILVEGNCEATGNTLLYIFDGQVKELQLDRLGFTYKEHSGYLCNTDGIMGYYYDRLYRLDSKSGMQLAGDGEYSMSDEEMEKADGVCDYTWNGKPVSEDQYYKELHALYNPDECSENYYQYGCIEDAVSAVNNHVRGDSLYIIPGNCYRYYTQDDIAGLSKDELSLARNEIFARHGYIFSTDSLYDYFMKKPWYYPYSSDVTEDDLDDMDRANLNLIMQAEGTR